jgi:two-component system OmpR family sensor kinase
VNPEPTATPGGEPPARRRRQLTLRTRLVLGILALVSLVSIGIGFTSVVLLNANLERALDTQLVNAGGRVGPNGPPLTIYEAARIARAPGSPVGTVAAILVDGSVVSSARQVTPNGVTARTATLTSTEEAALLAADLDTHPTTVSLGNLGSYRMVSVEAQNGVSIIVGESLSEVDSQVTQFRNLVIGVLLLGLLVVAGATGLIVSLALRPLRRVAATATQVASLPLDRGEVTLAIRVPEADTDPRTEVGQVGAALNGMLGHIDSALKARQASESRVRQFVADASHELRTPLASIRGYAELTRRGGHTLPDDVVHSMGRVESEAVRMTSLVEDLLLLARLDAGRDLEIGEVDLGRLLVDCVSDAYAAGPEHEWNLEATDAPVTIPGDQQRIHQVVANLLTNARVHTPAGTVVTVRLSVEPEEEEGDAAVITVSDNGPGIRDALKADLFERFARGDSSRSRVAGSTGLGLSIVRAVVEAHGGSVSAESDESGTVFRVELPGIIGARPPSG